MNKVKKLNDHEELIEEGLKFYDTYKYKESLPYLEKAYNIAPNCLCAMYNYANVLHMLDRDEEAHDILLRIMNYNPKEAKKNCAEIENVRGFIIDSYYLMFEVLIHGLGYSKKAFNFANKHLKLRTRGIKSCWTKKYIEKEIKSHYKEWKNEA